MLIFYTKIITDNNNSKILFFNSTDSNFKLDVKNLQSTERGQFLELEELASQAIITATNWTKSLSGISTPGQLGSNQQIKNELELVQNLVITPVQEKFCNELLTPLINCFAQKMNPDNNNTVPNYSTNIIKIKPIGVVAELDPKEVLSKDEKRDLLGYEPTETETI